MVPLCKKIADSAWFQHSIIAVIVRAGAVVGIGTYPSMVVAHGDLLLTIDYFILTVFTIEVIRERLWPKVRQ